MHFYFQNWILKVKKQFESGFSVKKFQGSFVGGKNSLKKVLISSGCKMGKLIKLVFVKLNKKSKSVLWHPFIQIGFKNTWNIKTYFFGVRNIGKSLPTWQKKRFLIDQKGFQLNVDTFKVEIQNIF